MRKKTYAALLMAALLAACKSEAETLSQSITGFTASASESLEKQTEANGLISDEDNKSRSNSPEGITETFYSCMKKSNYNGLEIGNCASDEKELQDARLNMIFKELLAVSNDEQKNALIEAQRSWLAWKNKEEMFEVTVYSSEQMDNAELEVREMNRLARRADELDHYKANVGLRAN